MRLPATLRALIRAPAFTLACVLSLGLALGANLTVFAWLEHLVLNPYPAVREPGRLVALNTAAPTGDGWPISWPVFQAWRSNNTTLEGLAAWVPARVAVRPPNAERAEPAWAMLVSGDYFDVLGIRLQAGRGFHREDEDTRSAVAVLSDEYWRRRFGGDPGVIGTTLQAGALQLTIIGIAPPGFAGTYVGVAMDFWVPLTLHAGIGFGRGSLDDRRIRWLQGVGRLRPGATLTDARRDLAHFALGEAEEAGDRPALGALVRLPRQQFLGDIVFPVFAAMLGVTAIIVLAACANVANLLLARATMRSGELAIRSALGAGRGRLLRLLLGECAVIAALGAAVALGLTVIAQGWFAAFVPPMAYTLHAPMGLNWRIGTYASLATGLTVLLFGLAPALQGARAAAGGVARGPSSADRRGGRLRSGLVVAQVSLSVVALVLAGLFVRSVRASTQVPLGFEDPATVLLVTSELALGGIPDSSGPGLLEEVLRRVSALPGVDRASAATVAPLGFAGFRRGEMMVDGYLPARDESMAIPRQAVAPHWFATLGIPIEAGREIDQRDRRGTEPVALVSAGFARKYWPGRDPIGLRVNPGDGWRTVVGIAGDIKVQSLDDDATPVVYIPLLQSSAAVFTLHIRANQPARIAGLVGRTIREVHPDFPMLEVRTLAEHAGTATFPQRLAAGTLSGFGSLALLLAGVGVFGVMSCAVGMRKRELGVRLALGETPGALRWSVVTNAARLASIGLAVGSALAAGLGRLVQSQLIGVTAADPQTYAAVGMVLLLASVGAAWIPARRAGEVDPIEVLRD